jgi:lactoylglutathione lyase
MTAIGNAPEAAPVTTATTGHVGLNVTDVNRSIDFYCKVFGFDVLAQSTEGAREYAFLGRGDQLVLTLWQQSDGRFSTDRPGLHHLAFNVPSASDVVSAMTRLRDLDVALIYDAVVPHAPGASSGGIFFEDPDGTRIEICTSEGMEAHPPLDSDAPSCGFF